MKTIALACVLAAGTAWAVSTLHAPGVQAPAYDPFAVDLEDRLASLEGRIARLTTELDRPGLKGMTVEVPSGAELARRVEALEKELERLRADSKREDPAPGGRDEVPEGPGRPQRPKEEAPPEATTAREGIEAARERARGEPAGTRAASLDKLAQRAGKAGLFELQEELLHEVVETAGRDDPLAQEALYNIGWARRNRGDASGAREAWLAANDALPPDHWRHGYARLYAAEQGIRSGEQAAAARELEDLIRDIEARPRAMDQYGTLIKRSRDLLASLAR